VADSEFAVFRQAVQAGGQVRGIAVPGGVEALSRKQIDDLTSFVQSAGGRGLVSAGLLGQGPIETLTDEEVRSPMARFMNAEMVRGMAQRAGAGRGDLILMVADQEAVASAALDALRREVARRLNLADRNSLAWCRVTEFPLLEWNEEDGRWYAVHHPFTSPRAEDLPLLESDPARVRAQAYDVVCNGWEMAGGSVRIHQRDVQQRLFAMLGIGPEDAQARFGHMLEAFEYGAPPHGGIAAGLERNVALLVGVEDIREVITFPKTKTASDPMTGAPSPVSKEQLDEVGLALKEG